MISYIWDLDGTLLDSYDVISESAKEAAFCAGIDDDICKVLTMVKQTSVKVYMEDVSKRSGKSLEFLFGKYREFTHGKDDLITLIDGAKEVLEYLKNKGAIHFVYTHRGPSATPILKRLGIYDYFIEVVNSEYGFKSKPSGDGVKYLIEKYHLNLDDTWYVGDRSLDVLCAKDAKCKALLYLPLDSCVKKTGYEDLIISDFKELQDK